MQLLGEQHAMVEQGAQAQLALMTITCFAHARMARSPCRPQAAQQLQPLLAREARRAGLRQAQGSAWSWTWSGSQSMPGRWHACCLEVSAHAAPVVELATWAALGASYYLVKGR